MDITKTKIENIVLNNLNVKYFANVLDSRLKNGYIQKIQKIDSDLPFLKIKINTKQRNETLVIGNGFTILTKYNPAAKDSNKGFSLYLNKVLYNKRILSVKQIGLEKIICFEFNELFLIVELFSHNNIILVDKDYNIMDCLQKEEWKTRIIKPKHKYLLPEVNTKDILTYEFDEKDFDLTKNLVSNVIKIINISPGLVEAIINSTNIDKQKYNFAEAKKIMTKIKDVYSSEQITNSVLLLNHNNKVEFLNNDIKNKDLEKIDSDLNDIFDDLIVKNITETKIADVIGAKEKERNKILKMISEQEKKAESFEKNAIIYKKAGDAIYNNYKEIDEILKTISTARDKKVSFDEIEKTLNLNKKKFASLQNFKKIDKKEKKVIFTLPLQ